MIDAALVDRVAAAVAATAPVDDGMALANTLRERFPSVRFTVCSDDDIPSKLVAAAENAFCRLYYVDTGEHCVKLTGDAEVASGLVVALVGDDA
ncbi:MAG: DUF6129 family protein [Rhodocyclaceae bacterium]|jgi:hypothetical protein|nr:DUF6129 family protein [Rhodocyclaceae bacterium]